MTPFDGIEFRVSPSLAGAKEAIRLGEGPIIVSPAMYDLIAHATPAELETLLRTIRVLRIPDFRVLLSAPLPLTTRTV